MGSENRPTTHSLMDDLLAKGKHYAFFQVVHLLNSHYLPKTEKQTGEAPQLRFRANATLAFPPSDLAEIKHHLGNLEHFLLTVNMMGLYGPASPLPAFYSEQIVQNDPENHPIRDFMDVFNHRFIEQLYQCWKKYRYYLNYEKGALDSFSQQMFSLIGLGDIELRQQTHLHWHRLLPYLGLLSMKSHSAGIMSGIIRHYFRHRAVYIEQCKLRVVKISDDQLNSLGAANCEVGMNLVLGASIRDRSGKFRVVIKDLSLDKFERFLPTGDYYRPLHELIRFIQRDQLEYDIKLGLRKYEAPKLELKESSTCKLGWSTWLGEHIDDDSHYEVVLPSGAFL
ncbi:type VI secretion system baseplate subunit TssG [Spartinivicinus marinus]|nr:type VI secretion system baseplate subunit TssG [Spartinivicinus marinus]